MVELNRAVAVGDGRTGPAEGPGDRGRDHAAWRGYHLLPSVRGDLLARLGRTAEARAEFERAASLTANAKEQEALKRRAAAL